MSFPRYERYKDSGVEWLGKVPEHWFLQRLKTIISKIESGTSVNAADEPADEFSLGVLKTSSVYSGVFDSTQNKKVVEEEIGRVSCPLQSGTLIVSRMNTPELVGATGLVREAPGNLYLPDRLWQVSVCDADAEFVYYWSQSSIYRAMISSVCSGTSSSMQNLAQDQYRDLPFAIPTLNEQVCISNFLRLETAKIEALIGEQRRLIELLNEKRHAIISHAVTKSLLPGVAVRDSGVPWLDKVPTKWKVLPFGRGARLKGGFAFSAEYFGSDGIPVVRMNNLKRGQLDMWEAAHIPESLCEASAALSEGDLVWGMSGSIGESGSLGNYARVAAVDLPCQLNQRVGRFERDRLTLELDFLEYVIQAQYFSEQVLLLVTGTAQFNVSPAQVESCILFLPPMEEQTRISEFLRAEIPNYECLVDSARNAIGILQERRRALITAAVTGRIDVRNYVPKETA